MMHTGPKAEHTGGAEVDLHATHGTIEAHSILQIQE